jgi:hypothetical protein
LRQTLLKKNTNKLRKFKTQSSNIIWEHSAEKMPSMMTVKKKSPTNPTPTPTSMNGREGTQKRYLNHLLLWLNSTKTSSIKKLAPIIFKKRQITHIEMMKKICFKNCFRN